MCGMSYSLNVSSSLSASLHAEEIVSKVTASFGASSPRRGTCRSTACCSRNCAPWNSGHTEGHLAPTGCGSPYVLHVALGETLRRLLGAASCGGWARCLAYREATRWPRDDARNLVYFYLGSGVAAYYHRWQAILRMPRHGGASWSIPSWKREGYWWSRERRLPGNGNLLSAVLSRLQEAVRGGLLVAEVSRRRSPEPR